MNTHQQIDPRNAKRYEAFLARENAKRKNDGKKGGAISKTVGRSRLRKYPQELVDRDVIDALLAVRRAFPGTEEARMAVVQLGAMFKWRKDYKTAIRYFEEAKQLLSTDSRWVKYLDESCIAPLRKRLEKAETIISFQKKLSEILDIPLRNPESSENDE